MADEDQIQEKDVPVDEAVEEVVEGRRRPGKMIIIIAALVIGILVAVGLYFILFAGGSSSQEGAEQAGQMAAEPQPTAQIEDIAFLEVPTVKANLLTDGRSTRYLKVTASLELNSEADATEVQKVLPRIQDEFQTYIRQLRLEDIRGSQGMYRLKEGLLLRVNQATTPVKVRNVLFKDIIIQ